MATLNNFVLGTIQDAIVTALDTACAAALDGSGNTMDFVTGSVDNGWQDFIKNASKGDGKGLCWIHLRSNPIDAQGREVFYQKASWRIRVGLPRPGRQEYADAQNMAYLYNVRKKIIESVGTNRTWSGNAIDSYVTDEQEFQDGESPWIGFELTITACYYYYYT